MNQLRILRSGLCSTVQDLGRVGFQHLGIPIGGAMDRLSHELANRLVGNRADDASIEMTLTGDSIEFAEDTVIAIAGADMEPVLCRDDEVVQPVAQHRPVYVAKDMMLRFHSARRGCRCYVAVAGGIDVPKIIGSRSTLLRAAFGGHCGRAFMMGDVLPIGPLSNRSRWIQEQVAASLSSSAVSAQPSWFVRPVNLPDAGLATLRIVPGTHTALLGMPGVEELTQSRFVVSNQSDRMGYRLTGHPIRLERPLEMVSEGTISGTLQLPPDGNPILLMSDCAPTGGYPRIGHVISADSGIAAQLRPTQSVQFTVVTLDEAQRLLLQQRREFEQSLTMTALQFR